MTNYEITITHPDARVYWTVRAKSPALALVRLWEDYEHHTFAFATPFNDEAFRTAFPLEANVTMEVKI